MTTRQVWRAVSLILAAFGALLLVETGRMARALGAVPGPDPLDMSSRAGFWYQLSFMRLFGVAVLGLALLCAWAASQLNASQQRSLGRMLGGVFALLALVAVAQQVAIWGAPAGWAVAGTFGVVAVVLGLSVGTRASGHAA
jgi:hypothetical protein